MEKIFLEILNMSLSGSLLILVVLIARLLLKKAPKWISCVLWGLVAVRLVCPLSIESAISLLPSAKPVPADIAMMPRPEIDTGISAINQVVNPVIERNFTPAPMASANPLQIFNFMAAWIWIAGIIVILIYAIVSYGLLYKKVRSSISFEENIRLCDYIETPFILGIIRPSIYLPSGISEEQFHHVIAHEKAHIKRLDYIWKPLGFGVLAIHWFNPLAWISYAMLCKDIEMACDERVISDFDRESTVSYSQALLECSAGKRTFIVCPLAFSEVSVKDRIKHVLNYKKPGFLIICIAAIICVIVAVCFLTNPKQKLVTDDYNLTEANLVDGELTEADKQQRYLEYLGKQTEVDLMSMDEITAANANVSSTEDGKYDIKLNLYSEKELSEETLMQIHEALGKTFSNIEIYINGNVIYLKSVPEQELPRAVMVNGDIYIDTNQKSTLTGRCGNMDGNIDSECDANELPTKNNQGNFGTGYGFQYGPMEGTIEIKMEDDNWYVFATEKVMASSEMHVDNPAEDTLMKFFTYFDVADYASMAEVSTQYCIDTYIHENDVFGYKRASIDKYTEEVVDKKTYKFQVDVQMETTPESALYPETETTFSVYVIYEDGKWLVDRFSTD